MIKRFCAAIAALSAAACAATPSTEIGAAPAGAYVLDEAHASITWRVWHLNGLSRYVARFDRFEAALDFDPANPAASRIEAVIDPRSVSTGDAEFDRLIATSGGLLDADDHPEIRFVSTSVEVTGDNQARVTGDLTFRGVTRPVTLEATYNGGAYDLLRRANAVGFSARGSINRSDFGAGRYEAFGVSDEVELLIEAEFLSVGG